MPSTEAPRQGDCFLLLQFIHLNLKTIAWVQYAQGPGGAQDTEPKAQIERRSRKINNVTPGHRRRLEIRKRVATFRAERQAKRRLAKEIAFYFCNAFTSIENSLSGTHKS